MTFARQGRTPRENTRLRRNTNQLAVAGDSVVGTGIEVDDQGRLVIRLDPAGGVTVSATGIALKPKVDDGLTTTVDGVQVKVVDPLTVSASGVGINVGDGLAVSGSDLVLAAATTMVLGGVLEVTNVPALDLTASGTYDDTQLQAVANKVDAVIAALIAAGIMEAP